MTKFFKSALILLVLTFTSCMVKAQTLDADYIKSEVIKAVEQDMIAQGFSDVEVQVLGIPFQSLELPEGKLQMTIVRNQGAVYSKRCIKALRVSVNGRLIRAFGVPLEIKAYKTALVATQEIKVGQTISHNNVILKKVEVDGNYTNLTGANVLTGDVIAMKVYRPGQPIDKRFAKIRADVQRDEMVTVVFGSDSNMSVSIKAKALATGSKGDMVAVQNIDNKKVYYGEIINKNIVKVNI